MTANEGVKCIFVRGCFGGGRWQRSIDLDARINIIDLMIGDLSLLGRGVAIPFSAPSTPSRYLESIFRVLSQRGLSGSFAVLNPRIDLDWPDIQYVLYKLLFALNGGLKAAITIFADRSDRPVVYLLRSDVLGRLRANDLFVEIRFLSTVDAELDMQLLNLIGIDCEIAGLDLLDEISFTSSLDFFPDRKVIFTAMAWSRIRMHLSQTKRTIAVIPFHAGDILFACKALSLVPHPFTSIMVAETYRDIVSSMLPEYEILSIPIPIPFRRNFMEDHPMNSDSGCFHSYIAQHLPGNASFYIPRPYHLYEMVPTNLIKQIACSLVDGDFVDVDVLPSFDRGRSIDQVRRVLLYFDGGWPLKIYPLEYQRALIEDLRALGYSVTILADGVQQHSCKTYSFTTLADLGTLFDEVDFVIGMDSFPTHYAAYVLQKPTIGLFSSTPRANLGPDDSFLYRGISQKLPCCPCWSREVCPEFDEIFCRNFSRPDQVVTTLEDMLRAQ